MEIVANRKEIFEKIAESFSWALSHSRISIDSLGEFATLVYLIKNNQVSKVNNSDCIEGENLFVLQFSPSMKSGDMERWMREGIACIGLMRKKPNSNPELESILQHYRTALRHHQSQEALIKTFDLIKDAELKEEEYTQLLIYVEQSLATQMDNGSLLPVYPLSMGEMLAAMLHYPHKSVYDPFIGSASLLMDFQQDVALYGNEINDELRAYAAIKLAATGHQGYCTEWAVPNLSFKDIPATCIVTFPPLFAESSSDMREYWELPIRLFLENEGIKELVMVMPEHFMISDRFHEIRKNLTDENLLDKIIRLPNGYFNNGIAVTASILQLRKGREIEDEVTIGNLAEDAEKVGRRREVSKSQFDQLINPYLEKEENGEIVTYDFRGNDEIHYAKDIINNDYNWSALLYSWDKHISGIPYGAKDKPFVQIMQPYRAPFTESIPDKVLSFVRVESVFSSPEEREPRERRMRYRQITEPIYVIGYSANCPLYYLEASPEHPLYVDGREILYKCIDSTVYPLYLAYIFAKRQGSHTFIGMPDYVTDGELFSNRSIDLFLRSQIVSLPSKAAQMAKMEEAKAAYIASQVEKTHMEEYVATIKKQYIDEVRSRKHNMRPYLRKLKSNTDLALSLLEGATSLEELKPEMQKYLLALVESRKALSKIVDNLSNEEKFGEPEILNVYDWICQYAESYPTDQKFVFHLRVENNVFHSVGSDWKWEDDGLVEIAPSDLRRLCDCIIENACTHGFADKDGEHIMEIKCIFDDQLMEIRFTNNGTPLPEGLDVDTYGLRGATAGKHAGTGDGGYQVVSIATHYHGYVELNSTSQDEQNSKVTISVFFPVAIKFEDYDGTDENA